MRNMSTIKYSILILIISVALSTLISSSKSFLGVPSCIQIPTCQWDDIGNLTVKKYGYPVTYKETTTFQKSGEITYGENTIETKALSWPNIVINTLFWFALLNMLRGFVTRKNSANYNLN